MSYKRMIEESIQGVYEKGIAIKILQHGGKEVASGGRVMENGT